MKWYSCILVVIAGIIWGGMLYCQPQPQHEHSSHNKHTNNHSNEGFCAADWLRDRENSVAGSREEEINRLLYDILSGRKKGERELLGFPADEIYTIPIVIHIIHDNGVENISDAQVLAGVEHMNQAFANIGFYDPSSGVDVGIRFCLARRDPSGDPTSGITRTRSAMTDLLLESQDITMKNLTRWDPRRYLNIWLVREITSEWAGAGVAGYAYFPTSHGGAEDGIVGEAERFGSSPANSSMYAHEAGHYLGLYHTFQDGCANNDCLADGDQVCDTPPDGTTAPISCAGTFNSCTTDDDDNSLNNPFRPVASGGLGDQNDLFTDYMDYGLWECYSVFTQGQKDRMRAALTEIRKSLLESDGCMSPCTTNVIASFTASALVVDAGATVTFTNTSVDAVSYEWRVDGGIFSTATDASYTFSTQGRYTVKLRALSSEPGCIDEHEITIEVRCPVDASFTASSKAIMQGETVTFTNTSTGGTTYEWLVDGVVVGTGRDFQHRFDAAGGYRVMLIVSNGICRDISLATYITVGMCLAPNQWNIWHFGSGGGVDFNSGSPVGITGAMVSTREGTASISDEDGNLLFYSDGSTVWNRNHSPMLNGSGLTGSYYAAQSVLIVPAPGSDSLYYIFTIGDWWESNGLNYSIIDMSLDGGLGGITSIKNAVLNSEARERVTAIPHNNCTDTWIVTHKRESNRFVAYELTSTGIGTTRMESGIGSISTGHNRFGYLKFSQDGKRLSSTLGGSQELPTVEVFNFNNATGQVTDPLVLATNNEVRNAYSSEFSPDGRFLYLSNLSETTVYQYDLDAGSEAAIKASKTAVGKGQSEMAFQLGPDGRIYIAGNGNSYLLAINYPNRKGSDCGFNSNALNLPGGYAGLGLPNIVAGRFGNSTLRIDGPGELCLEDSLHTFRVSSTQCSNASHLWQVLGAGEIVSAADTVVTVRVKDAGEMTLIVTRLNACGVSADTLRIAVAQAVSVDLGADTALCSGLSVLLDAGPGYTSYRWQDGSTGRTYTAGGVGIYWVEVTNAAGCIVRDTIQVFPNDERISVDLGPDTTMCEGAVKVLDAGAEGVSYRWQDGSTGRRHTAFQSGRYWVEVIGHCGSATDTLVITTDTRRIDLGSDTTLCSDTSLLLDAGAEPVSYRWQDGSTSRTFTARGAGTYWVEGLLSSGCIVRDTLHVAVDEWDARVDLGSDTVLCPGQSLLLDAGTGARSYRWQDGSTGRQLQVLEPGRYWVEAVGGCERVIDTIEVLSGAAPIDLGRDTTICGAIDLLLDAGPGYTSYQWQDGSTAQTFRATAPGTYQVRARTAECEVIESIRIDAEDGVDLSIYLHYVPSEPVAPGTEIAIPLRVAVRKGSIVGASYRAVISFNKTLLFPIWETPHGEIVGDNRIITLTGVVGESDTIALPRFLVALGIGPAAMVFIDSFQVDVPCVVNIARTGKIIPIELCEEGATRLFHGGDEAILKVRMPHHAGNAIVIDYRLIERGPATLYLVNMLGEKVKVLFNEERAPGEYVSQVHAEELSSGMYFVVLETQRLRLLERVVVEN